MLVRFKKKTPYTKREGSTKFWKAGDVHVVSNEYGKELIEGGYAQDITHASDEAMELLMNRRRVTDTQLKEILKDNKTKK